MLPRTIHGSPRDKCSLRGIVCCEPFGKLQASGKKLRVAYVYDKALGIKVFADKAFYAANAADPKKPVIVPFLLKKDAEAHATSIGGKLVGYAEAVALATVPF